MSSRRVLGLAAGHPLLRTGPSMSAMRRETSRVLGTALSKPDSTPHRTLQTTPSHHRTWSITPPREPSAHPHPVTSDAPPISPPLDLPHQTRTLMRLLSHSVVVCTSTSPPTPHRHHPTPRAMTMSSFTSLTLSPTPIISINIATPSRTYDAVSGSRHFNIHVLSDDVSGARVADWLTRGNAGGRKMWEGLAEECGCAVEEGGEGMAAPTLVGPGVMYVLKCRVLDEPHGGLVRVQDHVIVLGEVLEIQEGRVAAVEEQQHDGRRKHAPARFGLLYADRRYRQLGNCITPAKDHG
ncbi:flavin reductase like domain-containing protein [Podospora conica]|nr:flavin reductase like domain-containing protein [Schizothecium conicum]